MQSRSDIGYFQRSPPGLSDEHYELCISPFNNSTAFVLLSFPRLFRNCHFELKARNLSSCLLKIRSLAALEMTILGHSCTCETRFDCRSQRGGSGSAPASFLKTSTVAASRGKSRITFCSASGASGEGVSPAVLSYSFSNSGSVKVLRIAA